MFQQPADDRMKILSRAGAHFDLRETNATLGSVCLSLSVFNRESGMSCPISKRSGSSWLIICHT